MYVHFIFAYGNECSRCLYNFERVFFFLVNGLKDKTMTFFSFKIWFHCFYPRSFYRLRTRGMFEKTILSVLIILPPGAKGLHLIAALYVLVFQIWNIVSVVLTIVFSVILERFVVYRDKICFFFIDPGSLNYYCFFLFYYYYFHFHPMDV